MNTVNFKDLILNMKGQIVERPNKSSAGTLSGHAAGEPFEKLVYHILKEKYPNHIFKQYEFLNDLFLKHPKQITVEQRYALLDSPTALFLLSRGDKATKEWSIDNIFSEKQDDTADILYCKNGFYDIIDVKTRNMGKQAMAPNIISAYKLAKMCALMIDNKEYENISIDYVEINWRENGKVLKCEDAYHADLFLSNPSDLYINWAAAMQIQFHVCDLSQSWKGTKQEWAKAYLKAFVNSAKKRCKRMLDTYITPFLPYIS